MPRPRRSRQGNAPLWVMAYGDLMSLLLVFFIFVCSTNSLHFERSEEKRAAESGVALAEASRSLFGPSPALHSGSLPWRGGPGAPLLLSILFERGEDELSESAKEELSRVAPVLWSCRVPVVVAGYVSPLIDRAAGEETGDADRRGFQRAMAVVQFLEAGGARAGDEGSSPPRFLPASGGLHGGAIESHGTGLGDGRDRVDIYPVAKERG